MALTHVVLRAQCVVVLPRAVRQIPRAAGSPTAVGRDPRVGVGYVEATGWYMLWFYHHPSTPPPPPPPTHTHTQPGSLDVQGFPDPKSLLRFCFQQS